MDGWITIRVYKHHPDLVVQFAYLKDIDSMEPFPIGGIGSGNKDLPATECLAIITYRMPFVIDGHPVVVSFRLGEEVACNMLYSYPFLSAFKARIMFKNMTLISGKLGEVFLLESAVPLWVNQVPLVPKGVPGAFSIIHAPGVAA